MTNSRSALESLPRSASGATALAVAQRCAAAATSIIREGYGRATVSHVKGRGNVLTETDLASERAVMTILRDEYPAHGVLSEESAPDTKPDGYTWVIDPLDGTKNFSRGIPHFCFTMALCEGEEPVLGLTSQPLLGEEMLAIRGAGASMNGREMQVSDTGSIADSVVALEMGYDDARAARQLELASELHPGMQSLRIPGSAALGLAYVAAGRYDVFAHSNLYPWDVAAGILLVREAGGTVSDRDGGPARLFSEGLVAGTPAVHDEFVARMGSFPWRQ